MIEALALCLTPVASDGDSWSCGGERYRLVALSGPVDAPETQYRAGRWNDKLRAEKARQRLAQMLSGGVVICSGKRDRYRRLLCRVENKGVDAGDALVADGLAVIRDDWR